MIVIVYVIITIFTSASIELDQTLCSPSAIKLPLRDTFSLPVYGKETFSFAVHMCTLWHG